MQNNSVKDIQILILDKRYQQWFVPIVPLGLLEQVEWQISFAMSFENGKFQPLILWINDKQYY